MKAVAIWFSFEGDSRAVIQSLLMFRQEHPHIPCVVVDDGLNPIKNDTVKRIGKMGVEFLRSEVNRAGNLRGLDWCREEIRQMANACERHDADVLIKVDCDTLVLRTGRLLDPFRDESIMAVGCRSLGRHGHATWIFGAACAYRASALRRVQRMVGDIPEYLFDGLLVNPKCTHEDVFISRMILHAYGLEALKIYEWDFGGGLFKGWQYRNPDRLMSEYVRLYDCITFGNRFQIRDDDPRGVVEKTMIQMRKVFRDDNALDSSEGMAGGISTQMRDKQPVQGGGDQPRC